MVKLATAREWRMYGSGRSRERAEYTNAGVYLLATVVVVCGFAGQLSREPKSGLVVLLIGIGLMILVNIHDLVAHVSGRLRLMWRVDHQLLYVEVGVPALQALGGFLFFIAILFLLLQADRGFGFHRIESHALHLLIAGTSLWVLGSMLNSCQVYEQADGILQILQHGVQIPFFMGSLLFLAGAIVNFRQQAGHSHHGLHLLTYTWVWIGILASSLLVIGGFINVIKVVKMLNMDGISLEKLHGGAQEQLLQAAAEEEDGQTPLPIEEGRRRRPGTSTLGLNYKS
uniref:uncharacterized protein LOC122604988 n=1 Tax=Erigeron canadensis TaxID=72917 RepID=UPI001CB95729|nr:uncharacterized protein LOC122604988 [Erigeron canadensis]